MMAYRTSGKIRLEMVVEPETKVRFRYESEGGSHGGLMGKRVGDEKAYPTVKLIGYNGKKSVNVKVSLYTEDYQQHVLELKGPEGSVPSLTEKLKEDNTATFTNIKIFSKKREEVCKLLTEQKLKELGRNLSKAVRAELEKKGSKEIKDRAKEILNSVRLCFEAFEDGERNRLCNPLFSDLIDNQKTASKGNLRIHRMSKYAGTWRGGDEIILLCDKVEKDKISIEFYEEDSSGIIIWEKPALFQSADVHYQVAITFKTPEYRENTEKKVFVRLARGGDYSEPREFLYTPDFDVLFTEKPLKKRKIDEIVNPSPPGQMMEIIYANDSSNSYGADSASPSKTPPKADDDMMEIVLHLTSGLDCEETFKSLGWGDEEIAEISKEFPLYSDVLIDDNIDGKVPNIYSNRSLISETVVNQCLEIDGLMDINKLLGNMTMDSNRDAHSPPADQSDTEKLLAEKKWKIKHKLNSILRKRDVSGNTVLHRAVLEDKDIIMILRTNRFADADIINLQNFRHETALHIATRLNKTELVQGLIRGRSNPNLKNIDGNNCYHIASENNCLEIMLSLLSCRYVIPQLNAFNYTGLSPLHLAIKKKSDGCFNLLKINSADLSTKDKVRGRSLLHYAVEFWPSFVTNLLKNKETLVLVNDQDFDGNTPLHLACIFENIEVVKQLLDAGADPFLKNYKQDSNDEKNSGETAADLTTNLKILEILEKTSSSHSVSHEVIGELCKMLDVNAKWKCIAKYSGVDEEFINCLQLSPSPSKALLDFMKKENKEDFIKILKNILEMVELKEALILFNDI